jgi:hypothetical protein
MRGTRAQATRSAAGQRCFAVLAIMDERANKPAIVLFDFDGVLFKGD